jgi:hypothetical protein
MNSNELANGQPHTLSSYLRLTKAGILPALGTLASPNIWQQQYDSPSSLVPKYYDFFPSKLFLGTQIPEIYFLNCVPF